MRDDFSTSAAASGPEIDDPVGAFDDVEVVFDDDERVAGVPQSDQDTEQGFDVGEMQAGGRLVEKVEGPPGRAFAELACELDALRLAAGERRGALARASGSRARPG